jgi:hypothetical protein
MVAAAAAAAAGYLQLFIVVVKAPGGCIQRLVPVGRAGTGGTSFRGEVEHCS